MSLGEKIRAEIPSNYGYGKNVIKYSFLSYCVGFVGIYAWTFRYDYGN